MDLAVPYRGSALADQAYVTLRDAILNHELEPGSRLSVPEVARQLEISRSPAREAISRIAYEGLADVQPNRGAVVAEITKADLVEIYVLREVLEGLACRIASTRVTQIHLQELKGLVDIHGSAVASNDPVAHYDADQRFHSYIRQLAGNRRLSDSLDRLQGQIRIGMYATRRSPGGMNQSLDEHRKILNALETRDPDCAEQAAREHISRLVNELRADALHANEGPSI